MKCSLKSTSVSAVRKNPPFPPGVRAVLRGVSHRPEEIQLQPAAVPRRRRASAREGVAETFLVRPRGHDAGHDGPRGRAAEHPRHETVLHQRLRDATQNWIDGIVNLNIQLTHRTLLKMHLHDTTMIKPLDRNSMAMR